MVVKNPPFAYKAPLTIEVESVKTYDAKGDGVTDDKAAIQAAIDAAANGGKTGYSDALNNTTVKLDTTVTGTP